MEVVDLMNNYTEHVVRADWKVELPALLKAIRGKWSAEYDLLLDENFDELADNYFGEDPEDQIAAYGQELTSYGMLLFDIENEEEEYCLVVIPGGDKQEFEAEARRMQIKVTMFGQPGKQYGEPARRIRLASPIPHENHALKPGGMIHFTGHCALNRFYGEPGIWLDLYEWPPTEYSCGETITSLGYSDRYDLWAAILVDWERTPHLRISGRPFDDESWIEITFPEKPDRQRRAEDPAYRLYAADELDPSASLFWVGPDLFVAYIRRDKPGNFETVTHVWVVKNAAIGQTRCEKVLRTPPCRLSHGRQPGMAKTGNGNAFLLFSGRFYIWEDAELKVTDFSCVNHEEFYAAPTGANRFAYISCEGGLAEQDTTTGKLRFRDLPFMDERAEIHRLSWDSAVILRTGEPGSRLDLAQIWLIEEDTWLRIQTGAFGKSRIKGIFQLPDGTSLTWTDDRLCRTENLIQELKEQKKQLAEPLPWSEEWPKDQPLTPDQPPEQWELPSLSRMTVEQADAARNAELEKQPDPEAESGLLHKLRAFLGIRD